MLTQLLNTRCWLHCSILDALDVAIHQSHEHYRLYAVCCIYYNPHTIRHYICHFTVYEHSRFGCLRFEDVLHTWPTLSRYCIRTFEISLPRIWSFAPPCSVTLCVRVCVCMCVCVHARVNARVSNTKHTYMAHGPSMHIWHTSVAFHIWHRSHMSGIHTYIYTLHAST
jgi:hypothetical protein